MPTCTRWSLANKYLVVNYLAFNSCVFNRLARYVKIIVQLFVLSDNKCWQLGVLKRCHKKAQ